VVEFELYDQVARVGKAIGHGTRLEMVELLAQAEQSVEDLARITGNAVTTTSSHLQVLKRAGLVVTRREGTRIFYRLAHADVAGLFVAMKAVAAVVLPAAEPANSVQSACPEVPLIRSVDDTREAFMLDVRPAREYQAGHFPGAISIPLSDLDERVGELPTDQRVIVYCRGEFCVLARDAARTLRARGIDAYAMDEGVLEWRAGGTVDLSKSA
jgi:rhodanese-related sulfurtransferase